MSSKLRKKAVEEVQDYQIKVTTLGTDLAAVVNDHSDNFFAFLDSVLAPASTPESWVKTGLAALVQCCDTDATLYQSIHQAICGGSSKKDEGSTVTVRAPGVYAFNIDQYTEATIPYAPEIQIPDGYIKTQVTISPDGTANFPISPNNINLSISSDGKTTQVSLVRLRTPPSDYTKPGIYGAVLTWPGGSLTIQAIVT